MATTTQSRYATPAQNAANQPQSSTSQTTGSGTSQSNTNQSGTQNTTTQNMSPDMLAQLQVLIQQLMSGGTQQMATDNAARKGEINAVQAQRAGYSKDAAFADAQGAMSQQLRKAMESLIPSITRSAEASGASSSALRALLLQDASTRASESAAALGLNAATQYGGIANGMSGILEQLTQADPTQINALLNAFNIVKGSTVNSATTTTGQSSTTGSTTSNENKQIDVGGTSSGTSSGGTRTGGLYSGGALQSEAELENIIRQAYPVTADSKIEAGRSGMYTSYTP